MKNYEEMSDFDINKLVAHALGNAQVNQVYNEIGGSSVQFTIYKNSGLNREGVVTMRPTTITKDFCNNPADAEPIIIENRIGTIPAPDNGLWKAAHRKVGNDDTPYHFTQDKNPLRAAMIVFLKMNDDK